MKKMIINMKKKQTLKFLSYLQKLNSYEILGIARLLKVDSAFDLNNKELMLEMVVKDIIEAFGEASYGDRKFIIDVMRAAVEGED